jgi:hypothetical protein
MASIVMLNKLGGAGEWPLTLTRAREGDDDDILAIALEALRHHDSNPVDESELIAPKTKKYLEEIWNQWLRYVQLQDMT